MTPKPEPRDDGRRDVRCWNCHRLICRAAADAIRAGKDVEIKCKDCNALNYIAGYDEAA